MGNLKEKIFAALKDPQIMSLATITLDGKPWVRYVTGFGAKDLTVRFVTSLQSRKAAHIKNNPEIHVVCGATTEEATEYYLQISGRAEISTEKEDRHRYWKDELKAYFSGPDDPDYCLGIIKPYRIEYYKMTEMTPEIWEAKDL